LKDLKNQDKQRKGEKLERETQKKTKTERRDKQDIGRSIEDMDLAETSFM
jgi:hypothetical protein